MIFDWPISRYGWVKTPKSQMIERLVRMKTIGLSVGSVMSRMGLGAS